jgi:hypothetical protein
LRSSTNLHGSSLTGSSESGKYSKGLISDQDCDQWFIGQNLGDDEILMQKAKGEQVVPPNGGGVLSL